MFNPIPQDAPEWQTNKAHYISASDRTKTEGTITTKVRYYVFKVGRSVKSYRYMDKYVDDKAKELLEKTKESKQRLSLKGYQSPTGDLTFNILTHFGVYMRDGSGLQVYNPDTGESGYYRLITE